MKRFTAAANMLLLGLATPARADVGGFIFVDISHPVMADLVERAEGLDYIPQPPTYERQVAGWGANHARFGNGAVVIAALPFNDQLVNDGTVHSVVGAYGYDVDKNHVFAGDDVVAHRAVYSCETGELLSVELLSTGEEMPPQAANPCLGDIERIKNIWARSCPARSARYFRHFVSEIGYHGIVAGCMEDRLNRFPVDGTWHNYAQIRGFYCDPAQNLYVGSGTNRWSQGPICER